MKLDALARGDAKRVVAVIRGEVVEYNPLLRRHDAARDAAADHHDVFLGNLAQIAIVLLINAVKLGELRIILRKTIKRGIGQGRRNLARKRWNALFEDLVLINGSRLGFGHG